MPSSELLLYGLIVAGVLLFNYVMRQLAIKAKPQEGEASRAPPLPAPEEAPDYSWGRGSTPLPVPEEQHEVPIGAAPAPIAAATASAARLHPAVRRLAADRRELRDAIVLLTVLGPCRAFEAHDDRDR